LKEAKANLLAIFNSAPVGMILLNKETEIVQLNTYVLDLTGKTAQEMTGLQPGDLFCCHTLRYNGTCGKEKPCISCPVRNALNHVLHSD